ncbi:MAG: GntR family transcriptional regulator [Clostridiales bacterium]|nr:GntR family transcriptional regulator [Clostridiales bacterium]
MKGKDLTERVYREIKKDLMLRKIPSSELFSEQMLADRYHCSRTPAREAAGRLVAEGYLNKYPSRGYIVRLPTEREMYEMRYCCYTLERTALGLAIHNAYREELLSLNKLLDEEYEDPDLAYFSNMTFHYELAKLSGNQIIVSYIERLHGLMIRGESAPNYRGSAYLGQSMPESGEFHGAQRNMEMERENHRKIVEAMANSDLRTAVTWLCHDYYPDLPVEKISAGETGGDFCAI